MLDVSKNFNKLVLPDPHFYKQLVTLRLCQY
jgi:hypothetical protein